MKCRKIQRQENRWDIVWFNSYGLNAIAKYEFTREQGTESEGQIHFDFAAIPEGTTIIINFTATTDGIYLLWGHHSIKTGKYSKGNVSLTHELDFPATRIYMNSDFIDWNYPVKIFAGTAKKADSNYSEKDDAVADSLQQRLSIIRGELFYNVTHGIPLVDQPVKTVIDTSIMSIIQSHPDVIDIINFVSEQTKDHYTASMQISTRYGIVNLTV